MKERYNAPRETSVKLCLNKRVGGSGRRFVGIYEPASTKTLENALLVHQFGWYKRSNASEPPYQQHIAYEIIEEKRKE